MRPRIRSLKPEIHTDEELWDLEVEVGMPLFRAFTGLWNYSDREGRFEWRPRALKAMILPYWDGDFERALQALASRRFVVRYSVGGKEYGWVRKLKDHQAFNAREPASTLPAPPPEVTHVHARAENDSAHGELELELELEGNGAGAGAGAARRSAPPLRAVPNEPDGEPGATQRATFTDLKGYEPSDADYAHALFAGLTREAFDRRLKGARNTPIGGRRGVFDRRQHVRDVLIPKWKIWEDTDAVNANQPRAGPGVARAAPADRLSAQAARVEMLRAREAEEALAKAPTP